MLKLRRQASIRCNARPIVWPGFISVTSYADHGFDGEAHAGFGYAYGFVFGIVGDVGDCVEEFIDAVAAVGADDAAVTGFGVLFNDVAWFAEGHAGFDVGYGLVKAFARCLDDTDSVWILKGFRSYVIRFVYVSMEAAVIQCHIQVHNVAIFELPLVGDAVADYFVDGCTKRFGKVDVVQW